MSARNPWFVAGFLAGGLVAAAATLLFVPRRGDETIKAIREHIERARREAREAGMRAEADILTRYKLIRSSTRTTEPGAPDLRPLVVN